MQPEGNRLAATRNLDREIVRYYIAFLMRNDARFGSRHVGAVADGVNVVPFGG